MDRLIAYDRLAREDRFVRMRARDVGELKVEQGLPPFAGLATREQMRDRVHGILVGELQAMEGAGRTVFDFPDAPWEFSDGHGAAGLGRVPPRRDLPRAARPPRRLRRASSPRRRSCGGARAPRTPPRGWPASTAASRASRATSSTSSCTSRASSAIPILERSVDFVLADEITHVRMGSRWLNELTRGDAERRRKAIEFQDSIDERFNLGGSRQDGAHELGPDLDRQGRAQARRLHGRGDRAARQEHAALAGVLSARVAHDRAPARRRVLRRGLRPGSSGATATSRSA